MRGATGAKITVAWIRTSADVPFRVPSPKSTLSRQCGHRHTLHLLQFRRRYIWIYDSNCIVAHWYVPYNPLDAQAFLWSGRPGVTARPLHFPETPFCHIKPDIGGSSARAAVHICLPFTDHHTSAHRTIKSRSYPPIQFGARAQTRSSSRYRTGTYEPSHQTVVTCSKIPPPTNDNISLLPNTTSTTAFFAVHQLIQPSPTDRIQLTT